MTLEPNRENQIAAPVANARSSAVGISGIDARSERQHIVAMIGGGLVVLGTLLPVAVAEDGQSREWYLMVGAGGFAGLILLLIGAITCLLARLRRTPILPLLAVTAALVELIMWPHHKLSEGFRICPTSWIVVTTGIVLTGTAHFTRQRPHENRRYSRGAAPVAQQKLVLPPRPRL